MELEVNVNIKADALCQALNTFSQAMLAIHEPIEKPKKRSHKAAPKEETPAADTEPLDDEKSPEPKQEAPAPEPKQEAPAPVKEKDAPVETAAPEPKAAPEKSEEERRAEVKKVATAVVRSGKSDAMKKLLTDYGVAKLSAVPLDRLDDFLADVGKL